MNIRIRNVSCVGEFAKTAKTLEFKNASDTKGWDAPKDASASICVAEINTYKFRAFSVLRGEIALVFLLAELPRWLPAVKMRSIYSPRMGRRR